MLAFEHGQAGRGADIGLVWLHAVLVPYGADHRTLDFLGKRRT
jgi:hypothetical protein